MVFIYWISRFLETDRKKLDWAGIIQCFDNHYRCPSGICAVHGALRPGNCRSEEKGNQVRGRNALVGRLDEAVEELTEWCDRNCLELNVTKTEELVIDFRTAMVNVDPIAIQGQSVEMVANYE